MSTQSKATAEPVKCSEITWGGKRCTFRARYVTQTAKGADSAPVCKKHLNALPPGVRYRTL